MLASTPRLVDSAIVEGAVTSITNSDGTLTISPTSGNVVASLNLANPNTWTATQTFSNATFGGTVQFASYTVSTLPTGSTGMEAYVTDGDSGLAWGATVVNSGSGATTYLVWYNGSHWTVTGK
jgi:hypothetical protein